MYDNIPASIFFFVACSAAGSGLFLVRKSSKQLAGISWIVTTVLALTCWHAVVAGLVNLVHIPVNIVSIGLADLIAGAALWVVIWRRRERQQYEWRAADLVVTVGLVAFTAMFFVLRTKGFRLDIHYTTIDPAAWLLNSVDVVKTQSVQGMYYQELTNGLFIQWLSPLTTPDYFYKIFVFSGGLFLLIAGLAFYAAIRRHLNNKIVTVVGVGVVFLYLCGYPLNATLWGFVWLSMGVILITHLTFLSDSLLADEIDKWPAVALLMSGSLALIVCYAMFAPVVFISVGLVLVVKYRGKWVLSKGSVLVGVSVFALPLVIGLLYMFGGVFTDGTTVGGALSTEGASYRDLFSNFVPFAPVALFGAYKLFRVRQINVQLVLLPVLLVFMAGIFALGMVGKASSYYFYKTYNVLWLVVLFLLVVGISKIANRETAGLLGMYGIVWALILGLSVSGFEHQIQSRNNLFDPVAKATDMNDIFSANRWDLKGQGVLNLDQQSLYHYVYNNYVKEGLPAVPFVGYWENAYWYDAISSQPPQYATYSMYNDPTWIMDMVKQSPSDYVLVLTDASSQAYQDNKAYFDALPHVYSNDAGFVARLH